ncbi:hypothetical protein CHUAL_002015 [Chamberlinius hualienensis]
MKSSKFPMIVLGIFLIVAVQIAVCQDIPCASKSFGDKYIVCVCNETYCDTIQPLTRLPAGQYWRVTSSEAGERFAKLQGNVSRAREAEIVNIAITLDHNKTKQTIFGFGGAFTDAATINIVNMTDAARLQLIRSYFAADGIEFTIGRVPIGGSDFSVRKYTYDDDHDGDFNLTHFSLADEDITYKIPIIKQALQLASRPVKMFGSPWSAPAWMKTNDDIIGKGVLRGEPGGEYYETWANYFLKFLQEYKKNGIEFWGVTAQNEPMDGNQIDFSFNCMGFSAETQRIFIENNLGPVLDSNGFSDVKIMMLDDQRLMLPQWAQEVLRNDSNARNYVDGIAVHWYLDWLVSAVALDKTHELFPNTFILATEACEGALPWDPAVVLGSWTRGENYGFDIIQDLAHWTVGWVDWNLALNPNGGPNWASNEVDSAIIINNETGEFYKQPMFYILGHFSKFIPPGCVVIESQTSPLTDSEFLQIAFDCPADGSTVVVILNRSLISQTVSLVDPNVGTFEVDIAERSISTFVWWSS